MLRGSGLQPGTCPTSTCPSWSAAVRTTLPSIVRQLLHGAAAVQRQGHPLHRQRTRDLFQHAELPNAIFTESDEACTFLQPGTITPPDQIGRRMREETCTQRTARAGPRFRKTRAWASSASCRQPAWNKPNRKSNRAGIARLGRTKCPASTDSFGMTRSVGASHALGVVISRPVRRSARAAGRPRLAAIVCVAGGPRGSGLDQESGEAAHGQAGATHTARAPDVADLGSRLLNWVRPVWRSSWQAAWCRRAGRHDLIRAPGGQRLSSPVP
jgi:hypothetical protein